MRNHGSNVALVHVSIFTNVVLWMHDHGQRCLPPFVHQSSMCGCQTCCTTVSKRCGSCTIWLWHEDVVTARTTLNRQYFQKFVKRIAVTKMLPWSCVCSLMRERFTNVVILWDFKNKACQDVDTSGPAIQYDFVCMSTVNAPAPVGMFLHQRCTRLCGCTIMRPSSPTLIWMHAAAILSFCWLYLVFNITNLHNRNRLLENRSLTWWHGRNQLD